MKTQLNDDLHVDKHRSYDFYWSASMMNGMCIFSDSYPKKFHVAGNKVDGYFDTYDEAKQFALSIIYRTNTDYIISQLNKYVDNLVHSAKQQMHLRIAEFRGNLFTQIQSLKS